MNIYEKFNSLPKEISGVIDSDKGIEYISNLEDTYGFELTDHLVSLLVGESVIDELPYSLMMESDINEAQAEKIVNNILKDLLLPLKDQLNLPAEISITNDVVGFKDYQVKEIAFDDFFNSLIMKNSVFLTNSNLNKRFANLVESVVKNVRTSEELKKMLIKPEKIGGMDLNSQQAQGIAVEISNFVKKVKKGQIIVKYGEKEKQKEQISEKKSISRPILEIQQSSFVPSLAVAKKSVEFAKNFKTNFKIEPKKNPLEDGGWQDLPQTRKIEKQEKLEKIKAQEALTKPKVKPVIVSKQVEGLKKPVPRVFRNSVNVMAQSRIEDIKKPVKVMSPIEEIASLDLAAFHKISTEPFAACETIKSKVDLLADESYEKRSLAVAGWKKSPLSEIYRQIGQESFLKGLPVEEVIKSKLKQGEKTLTLEEFNAISDLNQHLRM